MLEDGTETSYQVGEFYTPGGRGRASATTTRGSGSSWPLAVTDMSEKDQAWAPLDEVEAELKRRMAVAERRSGAGA